MMQKKTFITAGVTLIVLAMAAALVWAFLPQNSKPALAAEVAQKSYQAVSALTQEQQVALSGTLQVGDPVDILEKAKNAKDLKSLTYDEFASQFPAPEDGKLPDVRNLTFLQFTDENGGTVVLGIHPDTHLPEFITVSVGVSGGAPGPGSLVRSGSIESSQEGGEGISFQWSGDSISVRGAIHADGTGTFLVNGKEYTAPEGAKFSKDEPPTVKIEGDDVYINGIKLFPGN
jgi:hypothetical protein